MKEYLISLIKNERIPHFFNQNGENYFYSGLSLASKDELYYENIDEAFNSYLTKIYLDNITYLKNFFIIDEEIRNILVQFDMPHPYFYSNNKLVKRYQNLFSSKYLFRLFYYASLYKDFEDLDIAIEDVFKRKIKALDFYDDLDRKREILWYLKHRLYEQRSLLKERQKIVPYIK